MNERTSMKALAQAILGLDTTTDTPADPAAAGPTGS
jgi:hypothetical protein